MTHSIGRLVKINIAHRQAQVGMRTTLELEAIDMTGDGRAKNKNKL
jgi:hypothetical protein